MKQVIRAARRIEGAITKSTQIPANCFFHGTRYLNEILNTNRLRKATLGTCGVSVTSELWVACYWGLIDRDNDEGHGGVLILDRRLLSKAYDFKPVELGRYIDEAEFLVQRSVTNLDHYIRKVINFAN